MSLSVRRSRFFAPKERQTPTLLVKAAEGLESPEERNGDLYGMVVREREGRVVGAKIGRSLDPLERARQLDEEARRGDRFWTHEPVVIFRRAGCLEPYVHRHFSRENMAGLKEYFFIAEDRLQSELERAVQCCVPLWNERCYQLRRKAERVLKEDDFERELRRRRMEAETRAYEERLRVETEAYAKSLSSESNYSCGDSFSSKLERLSSLSFSKAPKVEQDFDFWQFAFFGDDKPMAPWNSKSHSESPAHFHERNEKPMEHLCRCRP